MDEHFNKVESFFPSLICFVSLDNPYSYHWQQISAPEGSHGYMEGQDSRRVILSQVCNFWKILKTNKQINTDLPETKTFT